MDLEIKELAVGAGLAIIVLLCFRFGKIHREKGSYVVLLAGVAMPYVMWAIETHEPDTLKHALIASGFVAIGLAGARWNLWLVVFGLLAHAIFAGVLQFSSLPAPTPGWYGPVCLSFDVSIALGLAGFLAQGDKLSDMT